MNRYFVLVLCFVLLLPCLVVPASATTQGVIDAIEDLQAGLGDSQRDIVDLLTSIDDWIYEGVVQLQDISSTLFNSIWEGYCVPMYDYFFTANQTIAQKIFVRNSTNGLYLVTQTVSGISGFKADLIYLSNAILTGLDYALFSIDYFVDQISTKLIDIRQYTLSIANKLNTIINGDSTLSDAVQDQVNQDSTEASEYLDIMDDVTKPDVGELEDLSDISGYVNAGDVSVLAACLSPFFQSAIFLPCIMLSLIFMLVAYVLYGKR